MYLYDIYPEYQIENDVFECKEKLDKDNMLDWLKTIGGFSNNKGGVLFIGVQDRTLKLIGFQRDEIDGIQNYFNNAINEHLTPRPTYNIKAIPYIVHDKQRFILEIHIDKSDIRPIVVKYKGFPGIFMRRDGFTDGATYEEIKDMSISSTSSQYDTLISDIKYNSNDFKDLKEFYKEHTNKKLSDKLLQSIGFYNENEMLANGSVLFMDDYKGTKTSVHCSMFSGLTKGDKKIISLNKYEGNLINSIKYIQDYVELRMNHSIIKEANGRIDIPAYPSRALLEGIINAIAHRDYFMDGTQINVDMYKDRLEISSPGSFYKGKEINKTYDLSKIISKRRNELICDILVACEVMEASGTGFEKIIDDYKEQDGNHQPYVYSTYDHFTLVLPDITYSNGIVESDEPSIIYPIITKNSKYDKKILSYCFRSKHNSREITEYLNISDSSYFRNTIINNLVKEKLLLKDKEGNSIVYKTNKELVELD